MKEKVNLFLLGSLVSISLISPPGFFRLSIIEFSDFLVFLFFIFLLIDFLKNTQSFNLNIFYTDLWILLTAILAISSLVYGFNLYVLRIIFYCLTGFLFTSFITDKSTYELQYFFLPFALVTFLNLITSIFGLSFVDNTIGWISYFYEDPNFLDRGRLSGFQGSGPNVAGGMFSIITFINLYLYYELKNKFFLILSFINVFLIFITFSRGSYLSLILGFIILFFVFNKKLKNLVFLFVFISAGLASFLYIGDSKILLKESDRGFLTSIALENINIFKGIGPGNYVEGIYKDYFLSINPDILEENLNINLNKVELGITPEEYRDSNIDFFIGTSGGGFEILVQSKIISECSEDRLTCQHVRVKEAVLTDFLSAVFQIQNTDLANTMEKSQCFDKDNINILRGELYCFLDFIYAKDFNIKSIPRPLFFVPCTESGEIVCEKRELAQGELAVIVEAISIASDYVPFENYKIYCSECNFRNVEGFLKFKFEKYDGILPRSKITFYSSNDQINWSMVGSPRTTGEVINLNPNSSFLEIGGHSDGQSFGNTFLDAVIKDVTINTKNKNNKIMFTEQNLNKNYFVFKPSETNQYNAKITYENGGLKLFAPNKYWLAVPNDYIFDGDFEIILNISLPEIPWERQTLISNTSIFDDQVQSWKLEIDDGRLFFYWASPDGVFLEMNTVGDKSLRSGVLIQKNGQINNTKPPIVDPSFLSQLTTAHNGYLTFSVEFGLILSLSFFFVFFIFLIRQFNKLSRKNSLTFIAVLMFFIQNLTNDMVYSPDMFVLLIIAIGINYQSTNPLEFKKL